jgi:hypothetical protein
LVGHVRGSFRHARNANLGLFWDVNRGCGIISQFLGIRLSGVYCAATAEDPLGRLS